VHGRKRVRGEEREIGETWRGGKEWVGESGKGVGVDKK